MKTMKELKKLDLSEQNNKMRREKHRDILISLHNFKEENMLINAALSQYGPHDCMFMSKNKNKSKRLRSKCRGGLLEVKKSDQSRQYQMVQYLGQVKIK
ncbi:MAG: hypothetical protein GY853_15795 [PVC group bacterium]|nr:hypothetical protein [PVC group bacterium]